MATMRCIWLMMLFPFFKIRIFTWKNRRSAQKLGEDAADAPDID
jgi:hypothetical protein